MSAKDIQNLLRFLSQDAKVPMATAIGHVKALHGKGLKDVEAISRAKSKDVEAALGDAKLGRQVFNAAKRTVTGKKRGGVDDEGAATPRAKRGRTLAAAAAASRMQTPAQLEASLELPYSDESEAELREVCVFTNRAPLVLAFAVTLLGHTMPQQPLSARLSLAQAYVGLSSRSRAVDLGIESGASAADEGWGHGQPTVRIMGKDIHVIRRPGYDPANDGFNSRNGSDGNVDGDTSAARYNGHSEERIGQRATMAQPEREDALWGLDLEKLRSDKNPEVLFSGNMHGGSGSGSGSFDGLPIYNPHSARAYLLKAAGVDPASIRKNEEDKSIGKNQGSDIEAKGRPAAKSKEKTAAERKEEDERSLGRLIKAIDLVYCSWKDELGARELDRRTWGWYADVRPEIAQGREGWGAKNVVKLSHILDLKRK